jgi:hypothetical protein
MADFCRSCTAELWPGVDATDIAGGWALCEGCGVHYFDVVGERVCRSPQPTEEDVSVAPCQTCDRVRAL